MEQQEIHTRYERESKQNDAPQRGRSVVQPVMCQRTEVQKLQNAVKAEIRVVEKFPDQDRHNRRHEHRQHKGCFDHAGNFFSPNIVQKQRRKQRKKAAVKNSKYADDQLIPERQPEDLIGQQLSEVLQPDKMRLCIR